MDRKTKSAGRAVAVGYATRLTRSCLLLVGDFDSPESITVASASRPAPEAVGSWQSGAVSGLLRPGLLAVVVPGLDGDEASALTLAWPGASLELTLDTDTLAAGTDRVVREALAPLDGPDRERVVGFLGSIMALVPEAERPELSERLHGLREALRERLPALVNAPDRALGAHIDRMMRVDDVSFYVEGWLRSGDGDVVRLSAVSPEGHRTELVDRLHRCGRSDVTEFYALHGGPSDDKLGFVCFFETDAPSVRGDSWVFELVDAHGNAFELQAPPIFADAVEVRQAVLAGSLRDQLPDDELMSRHVQPAITRIQSRLGTAPVVRSIVEYGSPPDAPEISIVVPLYLQIDHLEAQLAEFANDPALFASDLVYVLDSPQQAEELANRAADLHPLYRVPFRIAFLERNAGFAGACNAGAEVARGRLLLLLNSDVLPDRPGWLETMRDFYDTTRDIGALGPKLLYEDDSIQHAGMHYHQLPGSPFWVDAHYFKGMHRSLPGANVARRVPLVSGACMMVDRRLYQRLGGFPTIYVQGDYEDADFCLRLLDEGLHNWYLPDAELYHLEGQSYRPDARRPLNRYNMWLHNHIHGTSVERVMESFEPGRR